MAKWFHLIDGQPAGPIEPGALKQLAISGRLKPTDKVRREDLAEWYDAKQVRGLFAVGQSDPKVAPKADTPTSASATMATSAKYVGTPSAAPAIPRASCQAAPQPQALISGDTLRSWYRARLGRMPIVLQIILWLIYGYIWIPLWWSLSANSRPADPDVKRSKRITLGVFCVLLSLCLLGALIPIIDPGFQQRRDKETREREQRLASEPKSVWLMPSNINYTDYRKCVEYPGGLVTCEVWINDENVGGIEHIADDIAKYIWYIGYRCPKGKTAKLDVHRSTKGIVDLYGKALDSRDTFVGTITINDLEEVRKFAEAFYYSKSVKPRLANEILQFKGADLFGKGR